MYVVMRLLAILVIMNCGNATSWSPPMDPRSGVFKLCIKLIVSKAGIQGGMPSVYIYIYIIVRNVYKDTPIMYV